MTERSEVPQATTTVPLHRARAALSSLIARCEDAPVTLTRNGQAVAVLALPSVMVDMDEAAIKPADRRTIRVDFRHSIMIRDHGGLIRCRHV
jgi:antitoxin (DNA-binding transcriptional repressor) of toxin-antitoxin stability system